MWVQNVIEKWSLAFQKSWKLDKSYGNKMISKERFVMPKGTMFGKIEMWLTTYIKEWKQRLATTLENKTCKNLAITDNLLKTNMK